MAVVIVTLVALGFGVFAVVAMALLWAGRDREDDWEDWR